MTKKVGLVLPLKMTYNYVHIFYLVLELRVSHWAAIIGDKLATKKKCKKFARKNRKFCCSLKPSVCDQVTNKLHGCVFDIPVVCKSWPIFCPQIAKHLIFFFICLRCTHPCSCLHIHYLILMTILLKLR